MTLCLGGAGDHRAPAHHAIDTEVEEVRDERTTKDVQDDATCMEPRND